MKRIVAALVCLMLMFSIFIFQFEADAALRTKPPITNFTIPPILVSAHPFTFNPNATPTPTPIPPRTINPRITPTPTKPQETKPPATKPPTPTDMPATGQNICSMGLYFREMRPKLTDDWFFFTPIELNYDGIQIYPLIASNAYEVGELKLTIENGQLLAEYWVLDGIKIQDEFLTFFPNLDSVKTVNVQMLGGQEYPFNEPIDITESFGDDTKVILYMNNAVKYNNTVPGLIRFDVDSYRPWMWEIMNLLD